MPIKSSSDQVLIDPAAALDQPGSVLLTAAPSALALPELVPGEPLQEMTHPGTGEDMEGTEAPADGTWSGMIISSGEAAPDMPVGVPSPDQRPDKLPVPAAPAKTVIPAAAPAASGCPEGHQNPADAKFCNECGIRMEAVPKWSCGHQNPDQAKFCGECGQPAYRAPVAGAGFLVELGARVNRVTDEATLSPAQRLEREAAHAAALRAGSTMPAPRYQVAATANTETIHFLADGLTFAGTVWMRGQEITLDVGSQRWRDAQEWWNLTDFEQIDRYGEIKFRHGPWPGKRYSDAQPQQFLVLGHPNRTLAERGMKVFGPSQQELAMADEAERQRRGAVPAPSLG